MGGAHIVRDTTTANTTSNNTTPIADTNRTRWSFEADAEGPSAGGFGVGFGDGFGLLAAAGGVLLLLVVTLSPDFSMLHIC